MRHIRMLADREGSPNHTHVYLYRAGEVYDETTDPAVSLDLIDGFIASGHAVEVDADGDPLGSPADKRETKPIGPAAKKAASASDPTPTGETVASGTAEATPKD